MDSGSRLRLGRNDEKLSFGRNEELCGEPSCLISVCDGCPVMYVTYVIPAEAGIQSETQL